MKPQIFVILVLLGMLPVGAQRIFLGDVDVRGDLSVDGSVQQNGNDVLTSVETTGSPYVSEFFLLESEVYYRSVVGTTVTNTVTDAVLEEWTATSAITDYQVAKTYERNEDDLTTTWTSSDEAVATVDANGYATWVSDGTATITATLGSPCGPPAKPAPANPYAGRSYLQMWWPVPGITGPRSERSTNGWERTMSCTPARLRTWRG